jgi:hypothetical protein
MKTTNQLARLLAKGVAVAAFTYVFGAPAIAQNDKMTPIAIPAQPHAIVLGTGVLPGATAAESWHSQYNSVFARNVTTATPAEERWLAAAEAGAQHHRRDRPECRQRGCPGG